MTCVWGKNWVRMNVGNVGIRVKKFLGSIGVQKKIGAEENVGLKWSPKNMLG